ncbi:SERF2 [Branchiostoma lanceolatum]|uniref:SERF2 protein n=1 Tax=Branchiostoma lanceolatum TaxID=7740 RepID=A0A8J9ZF31_BRALA|nr:SERF2 [Branchiostoma lanceolatum]
MTRGNQRELARQKNMKKQQEQAKKKGGAEKGSKGQGLEARKERDADVMRQKQLKAAAKKAEQAAAGGK